MCVIEDDRSLTYRKTSKSIVVSTGSAFNLMTHLIKNGYINIEILDQEKARQKYLYSISNTGVRQKAILTKIFLDLNQFELEEL